MSAEVIQFIPRARPDFPSCVCDLTMDHADTEPCEHAAPHEARYWIGEEPADKGL